MGSILIAIFFLLMWNPENTCYMVVLLYYYLVSLICLRCSCAYPCTVEQYYEDVLLEMYRDEEEDGRGFSSPQSVLKAV